MVVPCLPPQMHELLSEDRRASNTKSSPYSAHGQQGGGVVRALKARSEFKVRALIHAKRKPSCHVPRRPGGFTGELSAGKYTTITEASPATTTRDLADLVARGALVREGKRRYARCHLSIPLRPVPHLILNEQGELTDK